MVVLDNSVYWFDKDDKDDIGHINDNDGCNHSYDKGGSKNSGPTDIEYMVKITILSYFILSVYIEEHRGGSYFQLV